MSLLSSGLHSFWQKSAVFIIFFIIFSYFLSAFKIIYGLHQFYYLYLALSLSPNPHRVCVSVSVSLCMCVCVVLIMLEVLWALWIDVCFLLFLEKSWPLSFQNFFFLVFSLFLLWNSIHIYDWLFYIFSWLFSVQFSFSLVFSYFSLLFQNNFPSLILSFCIEYTIFTTVLY